MAGLNKSRFRCFLDFGQDSFGSCFYTSSAVASNVFCFFFFFFFFFLMHGWDIRTNLFRNSY